MFYMLCFQSGRQKKGYEDFGTFFFKILFASDSARRLLVDWNLNGLSEAKVLTSKMNSGVKDKAVGEMQDI